MQDRDLLELAAAAAGIGLVWSSDQESPRDAGCWNIWNPMTDDGDALRLAVKLGLDIAMDVNGDDAAGVSGYSVAAGGFSVFEDHGKDIYAATRRAIVRAAAEIGKSI